MLIFWFQKVNTGHFAVRVRVTNIESQVRVPVIVNHDSSPSPGHESYKSVILVLVRTREAIGIFKHDTVPQGIGFYISDIGDPYYGPKNLLYPKSTTPPQTEGSPTS